MSKIQAALVAVAAACVSSFDASKYKDRGELRIAIVKAANEMTDKQWEELSAPAQDWFNAAADAVKAKKVPDEFPDYTAEEEAPRRRGRASADDEPAKDAGTATAAADLEEGQNVAVTYKKRGGEKTAKGEVVEVSKRKGYLVVKDADGEEHEIDFDAVVSTEVFHGDAGGDEPAGEAVLAVGAEIEFETKRGKVVSGTVKELNEKENYVVLANGDDYDMDKAFNDTLKVLKGAPAAEEKPASTRRSSAKDEAQAKGADKPADEEKPKRSSNPKGVSVGARIRDLVAEDPDRSAESIEKVLNKEGIEFRPATLEMIFKDCAYLIGKLRDEGHMKKAK